MCYNDKLLFHFYVLHNFIIMYFVIIYLFVCDVFRSGPGGDDPFVQTLGLPHPAEGEAAEGGGRAAGDRRCFSLPLAPTSGSQTPPPALQTL